MSVSFEYELKALRAKLVRLTEVYANLGAVPVNEW